MRSYIYCIISWRLFGSRTSSPHCIAKQLHWNRWNNSANDNCLAFNSYCAIAVRITELMTTMIILLWWWWSSFVLLSSFDRSCCAVRKEYFLFAPRVIHSMHSSSSAKKIRSLPINRCFFVSPTAPLPACLLHVMMIVACTAIVIASSFAPQVALYVTWYSAVFISIACTDFLTVHQMINGQVWWFSSVVNAIKRFYHSPTELEWQNSFAFLPSRSLDEGH